MKKLLTVFIILGFFANSAFEDFPTSPSFGDTFTNPVGDIYTCDTAPIYSDSFGGSGVGSNWTQIPANGTVSEGGVCQQNGSTLNQYTWGVGHTTNWGNTVVVTLTANKWQMLTYTRNSSTGNFKAFIDARQVDTNTDANTWATHPTQNWQIGRGWDHVDDRYWNGQMAFFAVILNELTLPEIKRIYRDTYIEA